MCTNCSFGTWVPGRYTEVASGVAVKRGSTVHICVRGHDQNVLNVRCFLGMNHISSALQMYSGSGCFGDFPLTNQACKQNKKLKCYLYPVVKVIAV